MKTNFTKEERLEIYERLSDKVEQKIWGEYFTCWKLWVEMGGEMQGYMGRACMDKVMEVFPEFKDAYDVFSDKESDLLHHSYRRAALKHAAQLASL